MKRGSLNGTDLRVSSKAAREDTRTTNRRLVLQHLFDGAILSRADLARLTSLTPATVSALVAELDESGLVAEVGTRRDAAQVGKPPTMLAVRPEARNTISVDLSDPEVFRAAVVDFSGDIIANIDAANDGTTGTEIVQVVRSLVAQAIDKAKGPILGIA